VNVVGGGAVAEDRDGRKLLRRGGPHGGRAYCGLHGVRVHSYVWQIWKA